MKVRCMEVIEKRAMGRGGGRGWGGHHLDWMRVRKFFPSQGQGANLFISPGSYNEILRSTLL